MKPLKIDQITYDKDGSPVLLENKPLDIPQVSEEEFTKRLHEISRTFKVIRDFKTGRAFEIAIVNEGELKNGAILMPSTMYSSLTQNIGNAIELAAQGAAAPNVARVYIAFPGNGGSDNLSRKDRHYLADTGRFTKDGEALESVLALVRALRAAGVNYNEIPIMISADMEAGRLGLGIIAAMPPDTVTSAYFHDLPGISPTVGAPYMTVMFEAQQQTQREGLKDDPDEPYRVNDRTKEEAKFFLSDIYPKMFPDISEGMKYRTRFLSTYLRALPNMRAYIRAFSQHNDLLVPERHAVLQDTLTALQRQKKIKITFHFGQDCSLNSILECRNFGPKIAEELSKTANQGNIRLFIYPGPCYFHTNNPSNRWALEKDALH